MRITAIKCFPLSIGHRNQFVIKVETDEGIYGLGEGGVLGREMAMQGTLDHYRRFLMGMDLSRLYCELFVERSQFKPKALQHQSPSALNRASLASA